MQTLEFQLGKILSFRAAAKVFSQQSSKQSPLSFAVSENVRRTQCYQDDYDHKVRNLKVKYASLDDKGYLISEGGVYKYTSEAKIALEEAIYALTNQIVSLMPVYANRIPADLPGYWFDQFYGIAIEPATDQDNFVELYGQERLV